MNTLEGTQPLALIAGILSKEENKELLSHSGRKCRLFIPSCFFFFPLPSMMALWVSSSPAWITSTARGSEWWMEEVVCGNNSWNCHSLRFQATQVFVCLSWTAGACQSQAAALTHRLFGFTVTPPPCKAASPYLTLRSQLERHDNV